MDHEGPFVSRNSKYNGSRYNLLIRWENGEQTWEPMKLISMDDLVTVAIYGKEHNLLDVVGWKHLKHLSN